MAKRFDKRKKAAPRFKNRVRKPTNLRNWRKYRKLTLEEAAELAGMTAGNISAMERSTQGYGQAALEALADTYHVPPGWLLDVDPNKQADLLAILETAKPAELQTFVDIARTLTRKPEKPEKPEKPGTDK